MRHPFHLVIALLAATPLEADPLPRNPLCWQDHDLQVLDGFASDEITRLLVSELEIAHVAGQLAEPINKNTTGRYAFTLSSSGAHLPRHEILVFAAQPYLLKLALEAPGIGEVSWVNERLLYVRVLWGRTKVVDFMFDVEQERIVLTQVLASIHGWRNGAKQHCESPSFKETAECNPACPALPRSGA